MITKMFEIRDDATFIPVMATQLKPAGSDDRYLLRRMGFCNQNLDAGFFVVVTRIYGDNVRTAYDPNEWPNAEHIRTMPVAHGWIAKYFDTLVDGAVIDVEFILGEKEYIKLSERIESDRMGFQPL